jgi:trehalose 6-phosphate synthase/phosphatase
VIGAFDRCDRLAGLPLKMAAIRGFLQKLQMKRVLVLQGVFFPGMDVPAERALFEELQRMVEGMEVRLVACSHSWVDKYAILAVADMYVDTSIKDGLNLVPLEYVLVREATGKRQGSLVVSEFTGCSRVLEGAVKVNPWDVQGVSGVLYETIVSSASVREGRYSQDVDYAKKKSLRGWKADLIDDIRRNRKHQDKLYFSLGFGSKSRILGIDQRLEHLNIETVVRAYRLAKNRLILLDNEGTLPGKSPGGSRELQAHGRPPSEAILELLVNLTNDHQNTVVITSGRSQELLWEWFGGVSGPLGLAAEHGFYLKVPVLTSDEWQCILPSVSIDLSWKTSTLELMKHYVRRTQGTFIENKGSALVWQYRDADPDFGETQARELVSALEDLLRKYSVSVTHGKGYVEVKLNGVNKGAAAAAIASRLANVRGEIDFVLCVGDDRSDEYMFETINSHFRGEMPEALKRLTSTENSVSVPRKPAKFMSLQDLGLLDELEQTGPAIMTEKTESTPAGTEKLSSPEVFTVKVGRTDTKARFYVEDSEWVTKLLEALKKATISLGGRNSAAGSPAPGSLRARPIMRNKTMPAGRLSELFEQQ